MDADGKEPTCWRGVLAVSWGKSSAVILHRMTGAVTVQFGEKQAGFGLKRYCREWPFMLQTTTEGSFSMKGIFFCHCFSWVQVCVVPAHSGRRVYNACMLSPVSPSSSSMCEGRGVHRHIGISLGDLARVKAQMEIALQGPGMVAIMAWPLSHLGPLPSGSGEPGRTLGWRWSLLPLFPLGKNSSSLYHQPWKLIL